MKMSFYPSLAMFGLGLAIGMIVGISMGALQ